MNLNDPAAEVVALRAEVEQFRLLANNLPAAIAYYERAGFTCRYANTGYAGMFGFDEQSIIGRTFAQVIGEDAARLIQPQVDTILRERRGASYERALPDGHGGTRYIEVNLLPHIGPDGEPVGAFVLIHNITRHRVAEIALRESEERLAKFLHASAEGIAFHKGGLITDVNPPLLALTGWTLDEMRGRPALDFIAPHERGRVGAVMAAAAELTYETAILHRDGTPLPVEFIVRTLVYQGEQHRMTIVRDLRDRLDAQKRIQYLAHHDALTGLPNRTAFFEQLEMMLRPASARGALLFVDLDHFKRVNDSLGHDAGDALLQTVACRITGALRGGDLVARFGGDEFVVLLPGAADAAALHEVVNKLLAAVGAPLEIAGRTLSVTPSIGIARYPEDGQSADALVKHADTAMYHAKSDGRAGWRFFEPAMAASALAELELEGRLAAAVREQQFVLHYQPLVSLGSGAVIGCEALLRWRQADGTLLPPEDFIPLAESRRLMLPIGQWVLHEALAQARRWRDAGLQPGPVSVNLSTMQFRAAGFAEEVERALAEHATDGTQLELELTERMLMDDVAEARAALERLKRLGVRIAVDDFGTGYTSLGHLKDLPIDRLKIDRSFVKDLPVDRGSAAIARAIVQMARSLGLRTVAEGVEHEPQRAWAAAQGCDAMQGFLVSPALPAEAYAGWLRARQG